MWYPSKGKNYFVLGLGRTGESAINWLHQEGAALLFGWDDQITLQDKQSQQITITATPPWESLNAVVQSPGIAPTHPLSQAAIAHDVPIITDCDLFLRRYPELPIIGVTGTNGKSTTTALVHHILVSNGRAQTLLAGNIGIPVLSLNMASATAAVLELSSYQLELSRPLNLDIAVWLNLRPDHLERHQTMAAYQKAKQKILSSVKEAVIIGVDEAPLYQLWQALAHPRVIPISLTQAVGVYAKEGWLWDQVFSTNQAVLPLNGYPHLGGQHNQQNIAAAYATGRLLGMSTPQIATALATFPGLPHRQQLVRTIGTVSFINDSKATNAEAVAKALSRFEEIYWIAGGRPKSDGIDGLQPYFSKIKQAFLIGEAEALFAQALQGKVPFERCQNLANAVPAAYEAAGKNPQHSVVLLSPACASFDQYQDFAVRGEDFCALVNQLGSPVILGQQIPSI